MSMRDRKRLSTHWIFSNCKSPRNVKKKKNSYHNIKMKSFI